MYQSTKRTIHFLRKVKKNFLKRNAFQYGCDMKIGDLVKRRRDGKLGIIIDIQNSDLFADRTNNVVFHIMTDDKGVWFARPGNWELADESR